MGRSELASAELWEQGIDVEGEGHCRQGNLDISQHWLCMQLTNWSRVQCTRAQRTF